MKGVVDKIWRLFLAGMVIVAPAGITILVFAWTFNKLDRILGGFFEILLGMQIPGIGLITLLFLIFLVGIFAKSYFVKKILQITDSMFSKMPLAKVVYLTIKQLQSLLNLRQRVIFHKAVIMEYPRRGLYVLGFLANEESVVISGKHFCPVFVPTTPNPTSGYLILAENEQFMPIDISIENAIKMVVSAGIICPTQSNDTNILPEQ